MRPPPNDRLPTERRVPRCTTRRTAATATARPRYALCDALSSFSPAARATLNEISRIMGMPGKPDGIDGDQVEKYFREGKIKEIAEYCETDVLNTYRVWLRYELFRGRLTETTHQASELNLVNSSSGTRTRNGT